MFPSIEPNEIGNTGLLWLFFTYGYALFRASNLISEGSELLLLVPSLAGLVGGVVLPLLGAVPDGAIMLFSGLGDKETVQESLAVGVGALAGSTIMLLTIPWGLSIIAGRVDIVQSAAGTSKANYVNSPKLKDTKKSLLSQPALSHTGVTVSKEVQEGAYIMILTTIPYFLIQVPAFFMRGQSVAEVASGEKYWALSALVICLVGFFWYLRIQLQASKADEARYRRVEYIKDVLRKGDLSLGGALSNMVKTFDNKVEVANGEIQPLQPENKVKECLVEILKLPFQRYDKDKSSKLDKAEMKVFLRDFHESVSDEEIDAMFNKYDADQTGTISFEEFVETCYDIVTVGQTASKKGTVTEEYAAAASSGMQDAITGAEDDDDEVEEPPEDIASLPAEEQEAAIKKKAFTMLFIGTAVVLIFSDPMVDVLQEVAVRVNISAFYVSFVIAPLASNASEVLASTYYAGKKTTKTITVSFSTLLGAACMNNTFCLSIFMTLIFFRGLAWQYTAETIAIVLVQILMFLMSKKDILTVSDGFKILAIFPASIVLVAFLTSIGLS